MQPYEANRLHAADIYNMSAAPPPAAYAGQGPAGVRSRTKRSSENVNVGEHHDGSFGVYMDHKKAKLKEKYDEMFGSAAASSTGVFDGVSIYVNGYTNPSIDDLKAMIGAGGGRVEQYLTATSVSHVVAQNLTDAKVKEILAKVKLRHQMPVVYPSWVVDSAKAGTLLPAANYTLPQFRQVNPSIAGFMGAPAASNASAPIHSPSRFGPQSRLPVETAPIQSSLAQNEDTQPAGYNSKPDGASRLVRSAGNDPTFMANYFSSSRLHYIGGFRSHVQNLVAHELAARGEGNDVAGGERPLGGAGEVEGVGVDIRPEDSLFDCSGNGSEKEESAARGCLGDASKVLAKQTTLRPASATGPRVVVHVDIDCFFAQVALLDKPGLRGAPVAVAHAGGRPSGTSYTVKAFGDGVDTSNAHLQWQGAPSAPPPPPSIRTFASSATSALSAPWHSLALSSGEISSANYPARAFGIYAGMTVGAAVKLCPQLTLLPYAFDKITEVSEAVFKHFLAVTPRVQAMSCDEAFLDLTGDPHPYETVARLRSAIEASTGCTVSAGIARNMLLAKLATGKAKPNGQFTLLSDAVSVSDFLGPLKVGALPGVGWSTGHRLSEAGVVTVADLQRIAQAQLEAWFGPKIGASLYKAARGEDKREVAVRKARKSIGAEVNWGIRFSLVAQLKDFLGQLGDEVSRRMTSAGAEDATMFGKAGAGKEEPLPLRARALTFKLMVRRSDAPEARKFMGHGVCDIRNRTIAIPNPTSDGATIARIALQAYEGLAVDIADVRGVGIQMTKLVRPDGRPVNESERGEGGPETSGSRSMLSFLVGRPPEQRSRITVGLSASNSGDGGGVSKGDVIEIFSDDDEEEQGEEEEDASVNDGPQPFAGVDIDEYECSGESTTEINEFRLDQEASAGIQGPRHFPAHGVGDNTGLDADDVIVVDDLPQPLPVPDFRAEWSRGSGGSTDSVRGIPASIANVGAGAARDTKQSQLQFPVPDSSSVTGIYPSRHRGPGGGGRSGRDSKRRITTFMTDFVGQAAHGGEGVEESMALGDEGMGSVEVIDILSPETNNEVLASKHVDVEIDIEGVDGIDSAQDHIDPAFLAALPPAMRAQVLADEASKVSRRKAGLGATIASVSTAQWQNAGGQQKGVVAVGNHELDATIDGRPGVYRSLFGPLTGDTLSDGSVSPFTVCAMLSGWIAGIGPHPDAQHASLLCEVAEDCIKDRRLDDAVSLYRAVQSAIQAPTFRVVSTADTATWEDAARALRQRMQKATYNAYGKYLHDEAFA